MRVRFQAASTGAQLSVSGILLKIAERNGLRLIVKAETANHSFEILATFSAAEGKNVVDAKVRKNMQITVTGKFQSFGSCAVTHFRSPAGEDRNQTMTERQNDMTQFADKTLINPRLTHERRDPAGAGYAIVPSAI